MFGGALRVALYVLIVIGPLLVLSLTHGTYYGLLSELGRSAGLAGAMILLLQPVLAGRFKWVERPFGFDIVIRFHARMAAVALVLIVLHPLLMSLGDAGFGLLLSTGQPWYIIAGKAVLVALVVIAGTSLFRVPDRLGFERWRAVHDILGPLVIVTVLVHGWIAGDDLRLPWLRAVWVVAGAASLIAYVYHRLIRPSLLSRRPWRVVDVRRETNRVWTLELSPPEGRSGFDYLPGQFSFIDLRRNSGLPEEEHHFTISSSPSGGSTVTMTVKELGDYTSTIGETKPGDTAVLHGPFGRFSYLLHPDERDFVFIAGGIGITPVMSMLRHMRDTGFDEEVLLIYTNDKRESIVFREELEGIARGGRPSLRVVHVLSRPGGGWAGERGFLDRAMLERLCEGRFDGRSFYVCGPSGLLRTAVAALDAAGVPDRRIHTEIFSFIGW